MKALPRYKWKAKVFHFTRASLLPDNSQPLPCTANIDISLKSSWNSGWHGLDCHPIRFSFHRWKRWKRDIWSFLCSVFHVFNGGKWNGLKVKPAYVTRHFKSFPGIYRSPLYMKAFASYKVTTKLVENGTLWLLPYKSQMLLCRVEIDISLKSSWNSGWHRLDCHPIRSGFHRWKRWKRDIWSFLCSVVHVFDGWKWNGLKIKPAYVTRLFKSFPGIYRSPLYMKAFASYKVITKKVLRKKKKVETIGNFWKKEK